jgi:hypothetical protein
MPATARRIKGKWRVAESDGTIVLNKSGTPVDGGGHASKAAASRQATAINISKNVRKGQ